MRQPRGVVAMLVLVLGASAFTSEGLSAQGRAGAGGGGGRGGGGGGRGGITIQAGQECPSGTTETRPLQCTAPEFPPPSIVDYRPRSTLVVAEHLVPKAKFPVIDVHGHANLGAAGTLDRMIPELDALGVQLYISADGTSGDQLVQTLATIKASRYANRFAVLTGIDFRNVGPGWAQRAVAQLEADARAGAAGIGEISKSFGLTIMKGNERLKIDDPELDPIWEAAGRLNMPVFIHTAEPQEFFSPLDMHNERWLELALFADRRNYMPGKPTFEQLMTERDNVFRKHPNTTFVAAHFGWHANDLGRLGRLLDEFPNVHVEMGAVLYDLGRQPRAVHEFFTKYQDRILFGKDSYQPSEYPYYWRVLETADEYFDYYRDYHATWKMYGAALPDDVLRKVYYGNALKLFTKLPRTGFPG
jgi:predicted TIM-barrel fold metal-dependent hydrolase